MADGDGDGVGEVAYRELFEHAPFGYLSTTPDGSIRAVNQTLLDWTGYTSDELIDRRFFVDLLTVGGRIYHETHYAPALRMQGSVREIAVDVVCRDQRRIPALVNAVLERDEAGQPTQVRIALLDATERRSYERELLTAKQRAEESEQRATLLATTLQRTLIPHEILAVPGLDIAAAYRPAGAGDEIGGDFYDVFRVDRDSWLLAIGDIQGKGVEAAVVTALARYTIRAAAVEHEEPSEVLRVLNDVLLRDESERFCTAALARFRRTGAGWRATVSCGGHPPPVWAGDGQPVMEIGLPGTLLGLYEQVVITDTHVDLPPSSAMVMYTDGVTEARRDKEFFGEQRVREFLHRARSESAMTLAENLMEGVGSFRTDAQHDDATVLVARTAAQY